MMKQQIEIYQAPDGQAQVEVQIEQDTVWLSQRQMAEIFEKDVRTINEHIQRIFASGELDKDPTVRKFRIVRQEGKREVRREIEHYNLELIISVGYRVNSKRGIQFRRWATTRLKDLLLQGYVIHQHRLAQKEQELKILKSGIQILHRAMSDKSQQEDLPWLDLFAQGLSILDDYDHETLDRHGLTKKPAIYPDLSEYEALIAQMRHEFDSAVFGKEKDENFRSSVAQISKGMGEEDFYPNLEEKAAMLLYLITKNHSFVDGNKRIAAACFLLFLERNQMLFNNDQQLIISNEGLASVTLFVAASKPEDMETVKRLLISILNRNKS